MYEQCYFSTTMGKAVLLRGGIICDGVKLVFCYCLVVPLISTAVLVATYSNIPGIHHLCILEVLN